MRTALLVGTVIAGGGLGSLLSARESADPERSGRPLRPEGGWRLLPPVPPSPDPDPAGLGLQNLSPFRAGRNVLLLAGSSYAQDRVEGAALELDAGPWRRLPRSWRAGYSAVWNGKVLIVWGGTSNRGDTSTGARYDPRKRSWRRLPRAPLRPRGWHGAVWTGREMLVWGGLAGRLGTRSERLLRDGAAYDPRADRWRRIRSSPLTSEADPSPSWAVWTGRRVLAWNGGRGASYSLETDRWTALAPAPLAPRFGQTVVWTGQKMIVWGGQTQGRGDSPLGDGAAFDPRTRRWTRLPRAPIPPRDRHAAVWTGKGMLVWGGCCRRGTYHEDGALYRPGPRG